MGGLKFAILVCTFAGGMSAQAMRTERLGGVVPGYPEQFGGTVLEPVGGPVPELQTIVSWMAHLNSFYPSEQVTSFEDLSDGSVRRRAFEDLRQLENVLHGDYNLPVNTLKSISCANVVCGGGDSGKCVTCSVDE